MPAPKTVDFQVQSPYDLHSYISVHSNTYNVNSVCMHMYRYTVKPVHKDTCKYSGFLSTNASLNSSHENRKVVSDVLNKGHLSAKATFVIPRGLTVVDPFGLILPSMYYIHILYA